MAVATHAIQVITSINKGKKKAEDTKASDPPRIHAPNGGDRIHMAIDVCTHAKWDACGFELVHTLGTTAVVATRREEGDGERVPKL